MGMRKQAFIISELKCSVCGEKFMIPRKKSSLRSAGHIKDIWCPHCKKKRKFVERGDV